MDRTKTLLMSLTASALLAGTSGTNASLMQTRAAARISETIVQDPNQAEAENIIRQMLNGHDEVHALSVDEIVAGDSSLDLETAKAAVKKLLRDGDIRRTGDGTQASPFRYYDRIHSSGGHSG